MALSEELLDELEILDHDHLIHLYVALMEKLNWIGMNIGAPMILSAWSKAGSGQPPPGNLVQRIKNTQSWWKATLAATTALHGCLDEAIQEVHSELGYSLNYADTNTN